MLKKMFASQMHSDANKNSLSSECEKNVLQVSKAGGTGACTTYVTFEKEDIGTNYDGEPMKLISVDTVQWSCITTKLGIKV
jgi:hypothetical protein